MVRTEPFQQATVGRTPSKLLFLPGASGDTQFWKPAAALLRHPSSHVHFGWPGFGSTPHDPSVNGVEDLVERVMAQIDQPTAIIAQSMGGVIALLAAERCPALITHLVLTATSGGLAISDLVAQDWRPAFTAANPNLPRWFTDLGLDLTDTVPFIDVPALLLWGDADPISPLAVGERLASLLPQARLHVLPGGNHDLGNLRADEVAPRIDAHMAPGLTNCSTRDLPA